MSDTAVIVGAGPGPGLALVNAFSQEGFTVLAAARNAALKAFASIAEHRSFARAAAHLGVSPSALSQTIRGLEGRLGVRLLNRTTRSVAPSEAGARLLDRLQPALTDLDAALAARAARRRAPGALGPPSSSP